MIHSVYYSTLMILIHKTIEFDTWLKKLKDKSVKAIILQRVVRLKQGLFGDVKFFHGIGNYVSTMVLVTEFILPKRL